MTIRETHDRIDELAATLAPDLADLEHIMKALDGFPQRFISLSPGDQRAVLLLASLGLSHVAYVVGNQEAV